MEAQWILKQSLGAWTRLVKGLEKAWERLGKGLGKA
jgi:hypothetical protein